MHASANLNIMIKAARKAGRSLVRDFHEVENLQVSMKGPGDFVSHADRRAESILRADLLDARPNYGFVGEEGGAIAGADPTRRWIVDPLDGTANFLHALPHWSISLALEHKKEIVTAVVFDPIRNEMFVAEKGTGAWMVDGPRLRVSARTGLIESVFATGLPFGRASNLSTTFADLGRVLPQTARVRCWGGAALDLAYVAAGRLDGCWQRGLKSWDIAAGILLVREAGGLVEPLQGGQAGQTSDILETGALIAANSGLFSTFAHLVRGESLDTPGPSDRVE